MECPPLLYPETQNCTGRGVCVSATVCDCQSGYTGIGDFSFQSPSCAIDIVVVKAVYGIYASLNFLGVIITLVYLKIKLSQFNIHGRMQKVKVYSPIVLGITESVSMAFLGTTAVIRATFTDTRSIGSDVSTTVCYVIGVTANWFAVHVFTYGFLNLAYVRLMKYKSAQPRVAVVLKEVKTVLGTSNLISIATNLAPLGLLNSSSSESFFAIGIIHFGGMAIFVALVGCILIPHLCRKIEVEIRAVTEQHHAEDQGRALNLILYRLQTFRFALRLVCIMAGSGGALIG